MMAEAMSTLVAATVMKEMFAAGERR